MPSRAKSKDVRIHSIERSHSRLLKNERIGTDWKITFVLSPKPPRSWGDMFEQIASERSRAGLLNYAYELKHPDSGAYYDYVRASRWQRLGRAIRNPGRVMLVAVCPAGSTNLISLHAEAKRLIAMVNLQFARTRAEHVSSKQQRASEVDKLAAAIDELERLRRPSFWSRWFSRSQKKEVAGKLGADWIASSSPSGISMRHH